ncbi:6-pyruvoyltetrahydropterin synthase [Thamnocephalis sphaerospora]|uniref:6-pyruvoyltetrahydropterin synthase n=1 Tax=Thamnocephalis sphaerospora TaxID=78915 RepID=A0A4V1IX00_9FUNG|nr:6-pyruvoyltetrahydropterin synthase [Thamnocephalis sphaerospora]|eukprot:RKP09329.1 6-pyruvoyltetrahydropterin synthase [Thamnocephalis sphaerospora]
MPPIAYITRVEHFSAAHRLNAPALTEEENRVLYDKCNRSSGHGHNYKVEVTLRGPVDRRTGMVANIADLKRCIHAAVLEPLDHRNLDVDVAFFQNRPSTTENLAIFIWQQVKQHMRPFGCGGTLHEIRLWETAHNVVVYRGEEDVDDDDDDAAAAAAIAV